MLSCYFRLVFQYWDAFCSQTRPKESCLWQAYQRCSCSVVQEVLWPRRNHGADPGGQAADGVTLVGAIRFMVDVEIHALILDEQEL